MIRLARKPRPRVIGAVVIGLFLVGAAPSASALSGRLGAQVAAVGNQLTGELPEEGSWKGRAGPGASLVAELNFTADISLSFQPGFAQRNSRQEFKSNNQVVGYFDYEIDYVSLPLIVRVTGDPVGTRGFVTAGLNLNLLLEASADDGSERTDITDNFQSTSLGALFGAGVMVPLGDNFLSVELRYDQGLQDMIARDGSESDVGLTSPSVKYRGLSLIVGFLFSLGGE
jgi:hypothetical protein